MDFASLAPIDTLAGSNAGATLTIKGLDGEPLLNSLGQPHTITLLGPDSPVYSRAMHDQTQQRIRAAAAAAEAGQPAPALDPEDAKAAAVEVLARITRGWSGFLDKAGEPIPFSLDAARALFSGFPLIREQADVFTSRRANFLPVSSAT